MSQIQDIHSEILAGLNNESRIEDALENANFFRGQFPGDNDDVRRSSANWQGTRYRRDSRIMEWLCNTLASDLYKRGPTRTLADKPEASAWLASIYEAGGTDALLQAADCWATVGQVAAVQAIATEDPSRPVRHVLWPAHQFHAWDSLDEPLTAAAVAVIDRWDCRKRLRLWTPDQVLTYVTEKGDTTSGGRCYKLAKQEDNPFGIIPFAFFHYNFPSVEFWSGGPGDAFRQLNDYINFALTDVGDSLRYCAKPIVKLKNVRVGWKPKTPVEPGDMWNLAAARDADDAGEPADAEYMVCDLGFVQAHWEDIQGYLDHSMQCADVPPAAFRLQQDAARSGLSIVAERLPLVQRAEGRQRPFGFYERDLARVTCIVGASHLGRNAEILKDGGMRVSASMLQAAGDDPDLSCRWPSMKPKLTGQAADAEDEFRLKNRMKSRTQILVERDDMTREEAEAYLDQTAKDLEREDKVLPPPTAITDPPADAGGQSADEDTQEEDD
jgi:hypothetical protein